MGMYWHIYDPQMDTSQNASCDMLKHTQYRNPNFFDKMISKYRMWSNLTLHNDKWHKNSTVVGFGHAIDMIWRNQHPKNCSDAKFMIFGYHNGGFGSEIHVMGAALGLAMNMNRVLLQNPLIHPKVIEWELQTPFCKGKDQNLGCYYEPWSSCTVEDVLGKNAKNLIAGLGFAGRANPSSIPGLITHRFDGNENPADIIHSYSQYKVIFIEQPGALKHGVVPSVFNSLLACSSIPLQFHYYWWRAVATAYIVRPRPETLEWIETFRVRELENTAYGAVYIRRGEKGVEMKLQPESVFQEAVSILFGDIAPSAMPKHLRALPNITALASLDRVLFVGTEDPSALQVMRKWNDNLPLNRKFRLLYTTVYDRAGLTAAQNGAERKAHPREVHNQNEYLSMLLNIYHMVTGSAYVCTLASNVCRLVDELRATVGMRADYPYIDLSVETCGVPPCLYSGIMALDWR